MGVNVFKRIQNRVVATTTADSNLIYPTPNGIKRARVDDLGPATYIVSSDVPPLSIRSKFALCLMQNVCMCMCGYNQVKYEIKKRSSHIKAYVGNRIRRNALPHVCSLRVDAVLILIKPSSLYVHI